LSLVASCNYWDWTGLWAVHKADLAAISECKARCYPHPRAWRAGHRRDCYCDTTCRVPDPRGRGGGTWVCRFYEEEFTELSFRDVKLRLRWNGYDVKKVDDWASDRLEVYGEG